MKNKNLYFWIAVTLLISLVLCSCSLVIQDDVATTGETEPATKQPSTNTPSEIPTFDVEIPTLEEPTDDPDGHPTEAPTDTPTDPEQPTSPTDVQYSLQFYESGAVASDTGAIVTEGKIYKIVKPGTYTISGKMSDGQIRVEVDKTQQVNLVLNNFNGSCSTSAVIYVVSADKVDIKVQGINMVTDAQVYVYENPGDTKPNACIYSSEDISIKGDGTLYVNGQNNNGIGSKNDLEIKNVTLYVSAVKNALKGNDSVLVCGNANVNVEHAKDGLKSDTLATEKAGKGFVKITDSATVNVKCTDDAVQATQNITITQGAKLNVTEGTPYKCDGTVNIYEGSVITQ